MKKPSFLSLPVKRPYLIYPLAFVSASAAGYYISGNIKIILLWISIFSALISILGRFIFRKTKTAAYMTAFSIMSLFVCAALTSSYLFFNIKYEKALSIANENGTTKIEAVCDSVLFETVYYGEYIVTIKNADDVSVPNIKAVLLTENGQGITSGDKIQADVTINGVISENSGETNYYLSNNIFLKAESEEKIIYLGKAANSIKSFFSDINQKLSLFIKRYTEDSEGIIRAVFLGNRTQLDSGLKFELRLLGILHLIALSGTHLSILIHLFEWFFINIIRIPHKTRIILLILLTLFYMCITGFSASVTRSAFMLCIYYLSKLLKTEYDSVTSIFFAVFIILLIDPSSAADIGLALSFSATLGICTAGTAFNRKIKEMLSGGSFFIKTLRGLLCAVSTGFSAVLISLPFMWIFFGEFSPISALTTIFFTPLISAIIIFSVIFLITSPIKPMIFITSGILKILSSLFSYFAKTGADSFGWIISLKYDFFIHIMIIAVSLFIILTILKISSIRKYLITSSVLCICFIVCLNIYNVYNKDTAFCYYVKEGKKESAAVYKNGRLILCDMSDGSSFIAGTAADMCAENHVFRVNAYIITHYHNRHVSSFIRMLQEAEVGIIYLPSPINEKEEAIFLTLSETAEKYNVGITIYESEKTAEFNLWEIKFEIPAREYIKRSTHPVICLNIEYKEKNILYLGGSVMESGIADYAEIKAPKTTAVIFGSHSPVIKKEINLNFSENRLYAAVFSDTETEENVKCDLYNAKLFYPEKTFKFILK